MTPLYVRLYSRPGCELCDQAAEMLEGLRGDYNFLLEEINIDEDPALKERLRCQVPIITIDGGNRVALRITEDRLRRAFSRALRQHTSFSS